MFREKLKLEKKKGKSMEEEWREAEKRIKSALREVAEKQREERKRKGGWLHEECKEKKRGKM